MSEATEAATDWRADPKTGWIGSPIPAHWQAEWIAATRRWRARIAGTIDALTAEERAAKIARNRDRQNVNNRNSRLRKKNGAAHRIAKTAVALGIAFQGSGCAGWSLSYAPVRPAVHLMAPIDAGVERHYSPTPIESAPAPDLPQAPRPSIPLERPIPEPEQPPPPAPAPTPRVATLEQIPDPIMPADPEPGPTETTIEPGGWVVSDRPWPGEEEVKP